jgi:hypothetical protein
MVLFSFVRRPDGKRAYPSLEDIELVGTGIEIYGRIRTCRNADENHVEKTKARPKFLLLS